MALRWTQELGLAPQLSDVDLFAFSFPGGLKANFSSLWPGFLTREIKLLQLTVQEETNKFVVWIIRGFKPSTDGSDTAKQNAER